MSHLTTKQDNEMIFEKKEYNRLLLPFITSYVALVVAVLLGITTFVAWQTLGESMTMVFLVLEAAIFIVSGITAVHLRSALVHRRRIRDSIGGLVHVLDQQLAKLEVGENMVFGTEGLVYYNIVRRGTGNWLVQVFRVGDDVTDAPMFEAVTMKYRMAQVNDPSQVIRFTSSNLLLVNTVHAVIAAQCEGAALIEIMSSNKTLDAIDELEELANRTS